MKLQFAFGNPRRGKKRKSVAKRRKSLKTKGVKHKKKVASVASKKKSKRSKRVTKRKNPEAYQVRKGGKLIGRSSVYATDREARNFKADIASVEKEMKEKAATLSPAKRKTLRVKWLKAKKALKNREEELKTMSRHAEDGGSIKKYDLGHKKGKKSMAKKRRKKKKAAAASKIKKARKVRRRRKKSSANKAKVVKASKKRRTKKRKSKGSKRRRKKSIKAVAAAPKRRKKRKSSKRKSKKARRRARMVSHKHSSSMRHIRKGTSFRFKAKSKKGKRRISVSGRVKINPFRSNPLKNLSAQSKKYLGLDSADAIGLAVGGLAVPVINGLAAKLAPQVVAKISQYAGAQATGSVIPLIAGAICNAAAEHGVKSGQAHKALKVVGEGLAAAGLLGLVMGLAQKYVNPALGLSGINYTPSMRGMGIMPQLNGINYTPGMNGINYTPGMNGMGIMPQLSGMGRSPDFGSANYGGGGGSKEARTQRSDFGANFSEDSEAEGLDDQDNSYSSSMN